MRDKLLIDKRACLTARPPVPENARPTQEVKIVRIALLVLLLAMPVSAASFEQLSPADGFPNIQFQHLASNAAGQFVAVANSQVFVGDATAGTVTRVLANDRLGFVLQDASTDLSHEVSHRFDMAMLGTRLAINAKGEYVVASHTTILTGSTGGGEPRKVYEEANAMIQTIAINDAGQFVALTTRGIIAGTTAGQAAKILTGALGFFSPMSASGSNGNWDAEAGTNRLALNPQGQFVAASEHGIYGGSVGSMTVTRIKEDQKTGFRHVRLGPDGTFIAVSARNVYRGKL